MSWRPADIEFYRGLFAQLSRQAKDLTLSAKKGEITQQRLGSYKVAPK
jgi:hypothetical protein